MSIEGILLGVALGDALGFPVENWTLAQIRAQLGPGALLEPPDPAQVSDDTLMTMALAEGLLDVGGDAPVDAIMTAVGQRFIAWRNGPDYARGPGRTCTAGVERFAAGIPWAESGLPESKGCGSAMRVAPLGYIYQHDAERLRILAAASSRITHLHPTAVAASVTAAYWVKLALDGTAPESFIRQTLDFVAGMSDDLDAALLRIGHVMGWGDSDAAIRHIAPNGWIVEEVLAVALYSVLRSPDDYAWAVRRAALIDGDSDSTAAIAGGIMGARLGVGGLPADWVARCERRDDLRDLCRRLQEARG